MKASPLFYASALLLTVGCSGGSTGETSETISAQSGGTVSLEDSRLVIPGNALAEDTSVTLSYDDLADHAALDGALDVVLSIKPANLSLSIPATLTLVLAGAPENGGATVHQFGDGVWIPVESQAASGGGLQVSVSTLGSFAVVPLAVGMGGNQIQGVVRWGNGDVAAEAPVALLRDGSPLTQTLSDAQGAYSFVDLQPGTYTISVNYECLFEETVEVKADAPSELDIVLCS